MKPLMNMFEEIISLDNLFRAAHVTLARGRRFYGEGAVFKFNLEGEIFRLHEQLANGTYRHGLYRVFEIRDPKPRTIAAAAFRDRVLHHALHDVIEPRVDRIFIHDSYACRKEKGVQKALDRAQSFLRANKYVIHLDVKSYFQNINHDILKSLLRRVVGDARVMDLLEMIIDSTRYLAMNGYDNAGKRRVSDVTHEDNQLYLFEDDVETVKSGGSSGPALPFGKDVGVCRVRLRSDASRFAKASQDKTTGQAATAEGRDGPPGRPFSIKGLPLGNLTSQFFANLYLNEMDQYVKHQLKARYYVRYMDDMVLFDNRKELLSETEQAVRAFATESLSLELHPSGGPSPVSKGLSFLGFRIFSDYRKLKDTSVSRFVQRMKRYTAEYFALNSCRGEQAEFLAKIRQSTQSFNAHAMNGNTYRIRKVLYDRFPIINQYGLAGM